MHFGFFFFAFQVEMLYQRYFLRMNQNTTNHILGLLLALILALTVIHIIFVALYFEEENFSKTFLIANSSENSPSLPQIVQQPDLGSSSYRIHENLNYSNGGQHGGETFIENSNKWTDQSNLLPVASKNERKRISSWQGMMQINGESKAAFIADKNYSFIREKRKFYRIHKHRYKRFR